MKQGLCSVAAVLALTASTGWAVVDFSQTHTNTTPVDDQAVPGDAIFSDGLARFSFFFDRNSNFVFDGVSTDRQAVYESVGLVNSNGATGLASDTRRAFVYDNLNQHDVGADDTGTNNLSGLTNLTAQLIGSSSGTTNDPGFLLRHQTPVGSITLAELGTFVIRYTTNGGGTLFTEAGFQIWDIDGNESGSEGWIVRAYNAASVLIFSNATPSFTNNNPLTSLDGQPYNVNITTNSKISGFENEAIQFITIDFNGTKTTGIGLAFDNFYATGPIPEPSAVLGLGAAALLAVAAARRRR